MKKRSHNQPTNQQTRMWLTIRSFLLAEFPFAYELLTIVQSFRGALEVRLYHHHHHHHHHYKKCRNVSIHKQEKEEEEEEDAADPKQNLHWFHALFLTIVCAHGGAISTPTGFGQSIDILSDDWKLLLCIGFFLGLRYTTTTISFVESIFLPCHPCYHRYYYYYYYITIPMTFFLMIISQLYRTIYTIHYTSVGYQYFSKQDFLGSQYSSTPSSTSTSLRRLLQQQQQRRLVYPIPIFGPILYGTLFGCMSGFLQRTFHGRLEKEGLPRTVRNGRYVGSSSSSSLLPLFWKYHPSVEYTTI
jgi:hypothetical protein